MRDEAAKCRRYLVNYAKGAKMDAEAVERLVRGLDALRDKYATDSDIVALERHFYALEEAGLRAMRRRA